MTQDQKYRLRTIDRISENGLNGLKSICEISDSHPDPHAIIARSTKVDTDHYPNLLAIARAGSGVNNISVDKATTKGICVFSAPGTNANAVAELIFTMLGYYARKLENALAFTRSLIGEDDETIAKLMEREKARFTGFELEGKTLGVIGLGNIGYRTANRGLRDGMNVVGYDAYPTYDNMHQLDQRVEVVRRMDDVLRRADILTVHVPLNSETKGMIGSGELATLKTGCILVNYARGGIYDDAAVIAGLNAGNIAVYITDFPTRALLQHSGVICTPHLGASTAESEEKCAETSARQILHYLQFGVVERSVNFPVVDSFPRSGIRSRLIVVNRDIPGMIAGITETLKRMGVNISHHTNESNGKIGYDITDSASLISSEAVECIEAIEGVIRVRLLRF